MKILVIRAADMAEATAARLASVGHEAVELPLAAYRRVAHDLPGGRFDGVVLTSAAAVDGLQAGGVLDRLRHLPAFCVGPATARAAMAAGFGEVEAGAGDAVLLAELLARRFGDGGARLLYPAARDRAFDFGTALAPHRIEVATVIVYAADLVDPGESALGAALAACAGGMVLLYSARVAAQLFRLAAEHDLQPDLAGLTFLAISENVAAAVPAGLPVRVAARPDEDALFDLIGRPGGMAFPGTENGNGQ